MRGLCYLVGDDLTVVGLCEDAIAAIFEEKHRLLDSELVWACALQLSNATNTDTLDIGW